MLERPVLVEAKFIEDLQEYWHVAQAINRIVDSADPPLSAGNFKQKRAEAAIQIIPTLDGLATALEARLVDMVTELGSVIL